ncbi:MAG: hypothetical protein V3V26_02480 [Candidatus Aenigmarchaeota archaeon]
MRGKTTLLAVAILLVLAPAALAQGEPAADCINQCLDDDCRIGCILHLDVSADCLEMCLGYGIAGDRCDSLCMHQKVTMGVEPVASGRELTTGPAAPATISAEEGSAVAPIMLGIGIIFIVILFIHYSPKLHYGTGNRKDTGRKKARPDRNKGKGKISGRKKGRR